MTTTFPSAGRRERGYDPDQVDAFLRDARRCYDDEADRSLTSETIRRVSFDMRRGGYSASAVDRVLERLEDAFAVRERDRTVALALVVVAAARVAQEILDRVSRPAGERFDRAGLLTTGYDRREVDRFADRVAKYFRGTKPMSVDDVRTVAFHPRRGGYREEQVDLLLDAVIDVMNAVR
jgi:DivIVA domain-containing protein